MTVLPLRPVPQPGEALPGYFARTATRYPGMTGVTLAKTLGVTGAHRLFAHSGWTTKPTPHAVRRALALDARTLHALTTPHLFAPTPGMPRSRTAPASCPECLHNDPTYWPTHWWSPWVSYCPHHHRVLTTCHTCWANATGLPATGTHTHRSIKPAPRLADAQQWILDQIDQRQHHDSANADTALQEAARWLRALTRLHHATHPDTPNLRVIDFRHPKVTARHLTAAIELHHDTATTNGPRFQLRTALAVCTAPERRRIAKTGVGGVIAERAGINRTRPGLPVTPSRHSDQWPHIIPPDLFHTALADLLADLSWTRARIIGMWLCQRSTLASYRAVGRNTDATRAHTNNMTVATTRVIDRIEADGRNPQLADAITRQIRVLDKHAPTAQWGTRRRRVQSWAQNPRWKPRTTLHHLPRDVTRDLTRDDVILWLWGAWTCSHPAAAPLTTRAHHNHLNHVARQLEEQLGDPSRHLAAALTGATAA
jgi:hypothetical protein